MIKYKMVNHMPLRCVLLIFFLVIVFSASSYSQANIKDSAIFTPMFSAHYAFEKPGGYLSNTFGYNSDVGASILIKTKSNWIFGINYDFMFGNEVRDSSILNMIKDKAGYVIDQQGIYANVNLSERGNYVYFKIGKIIPCLGPNPNSGIMLTGSCGFLEHKIRIDVQDNTAPQLTASYKEGYGQTYQRFRN